MGPDADGWIQVSVDGGKSWQAAGRLPAQAAAFTAVTRRHLLAATDDGTSYQGLSTRRSGLVFKGL